MAEDPIERFFRKTSDLFTLEEKRRIALIKQRGPLCYYLNKKGEVVVYNQVIGDDIAARNGWKKLDGKEGKKLRKQQLAEKQRLRAERKKQRQTQTAAKPKPLQKRQNRHI